MRNVKELEINFEEMMDNTCSSKMKTEPLPTKARQPNYLM